MLREIILNSLEKYGDNIFLDNGEEKWTYSKILCDVNGLKIYETVKYSLALKNGYEFIINFLALILSHKSPLLLNPQIPESIAKGIVKNIGFNTIINNENLLKKILSDDILYKKEEEIVDDIPAFYLLSSGTTGNPKIVARSHRALSHQSKILIKLLEIDEHSRVLAIPPFFHSYGVEAILLNTIMSGGTLIIPKKSLFGFSLAKYIDDSNCTHLFGNPPFVDLLLQYKKENKKSFSTVIKVVSGGALIKDEMAKNFTNLFDFNLSTVYGLSEAGCVSFSDSKKIIKKGSVGKFLDGYEGKTTDIEGKELKKGKMGIIWIKKPYDDLGYVFDKKLNDETFKDGWFKTGDLGFIDKNNEVFLQGARSDKINIGGEKVDPGLVEVEINKIKNVIECVVYPVTHKIYGNKINTIIYGENLEEENIRNILKEKLEPVAVPTSIIISKTALKRTAAGKLSRELYSC